MFCSNTIWFKWIIFSFGYLSSDIARYSADFDANFMPARYFIWFETILKYTYWIFHYISKTFYGPRIGQIQFTLFPFIGKAVNRYLNLWPALLVFVFYFNSSEYWNIGQYEKKKKYVYPNPRLIWPVIFLWKASHRSTWMFLGGVETIVY